MSPSLAAPAERETREREIERDDSSPAEQSERQVRNDIRAECRAALIACATNSTSAMSRADAEQFYRTGLTEESLAFAESETEKTEELRRYQHERIPQFIQQAERMGQKALSIIDRAEQSKWILPKSAAKWRALLKQGTWLETRTFIEQTLPKYSQNWAQIAKDYVRARNLEKELGLKQEDLKAMPDVALLHSAAFQSGQYKYTERRKMVSKALATLEARKKDGKEKVKEGSGSATIDALRAKVQANIGKIRLPIVRETIRGRLQQILQKATTEKKLESHSQFLQDILADWPRIRQFVSLEERRKKEGSPMSFNFVSMTVFLWEWNDGQRNSYLSEANRRFIDVHKEREVFLRIRQALDMQDWDEAADLIRGEKADAMNLSKQNQDKLSSMEKFLLSHRPAETKQKEQEKKKPNDLEVVEQMRALMQLIPSSQRKLHGECLRRGVGAFRANRSIWYNRVWCHRHNRGDDASEMHGKEEAEEKTFERIEHGHGLGFEANDVRGNHNRLSAIREQKKFRAPQWLYINQDSASTIADMCDREQNNRNFWYWTSVIPDSVSYGQQEFVVDNVHPQMMRLARELERRGILYTGFGNVDYKRKTLASEKTPAKAAPAQALAA